MTLIELLVVMLIISILAALVLGVAAIAGQSAREAGTRHTVQRLHQLLTEFSGTFKTRRVRLRPDVAGIEGVETQVRRHFANDTIRQGQALAEARLYALREMMLMEMPDRWSDVILEPIENFSASAAPIPPLYLEGRTALSNVYFRRFVQILNGTNTITGTTNTPEQLRENQGAECLYMVVMTACGDGEARTLFGEHIIGDTDGDGAPEFLDGWGHPIEFLRWAPGFDSAIQINANKLDNAPAGPLAAWTAASAGDHDPFDMFRVESIAPRLVPLIYSAGRDEKAGLVTAPEFVPWRLPQNLSFSNKGPFVGPQLIPYFRVDANVPGDYLGSDLKLVDPSADGASADNIHNHLLGQR